MIIPQPSPHGSDSTEPNYCDDLIPAILSFPLFSAQNNQVFSNTAILKSIESLFPSTIIKVENI